jgi:hypothetical protein
VTARYLPASAVHVGDHVRIDGRETVVTHTQPGTPRAGMVTVTDSAARAFGFGGSTPVQIVGLT